MTDKYESIGKQTYLKVTFIFFCGWLFIAYVFFRNILELGGFTGLMDEIKNGGYSDLLLLALSIFFLAKFFQSLYMYLSFKDDAS